MLQKWWESAIAYFDAGVVVCVVLMRFTFCVFTISGEVNEGLDYVNRSRSSSAQSCTWFKGSISVFSCCPHGFGAHFRSRMDF